MFLITFEDGVPLPEHNERSRIEWAKIDKPIFELGLIGVNETKSLPIGAVSYSQYKEGIILLQTNEQRNIVAQAIVGKYKDGDGYRYTTIRYDFDTQEFQITEKLETDIADWAWKDGI